MTAALGGLATGLGSLPGQDPDEAVRMVAGELPDLPHLVELPDRGPGADLIGRTVGLLVDIHGEVVPSGWRVSRRPGRDMRRAHDYLAWDLDAAQTAYAGAARVKVQVCGPWTLAAGLEVPSGNRALNDDGAVDDLTASLIEGLSDHVLQVGRRIPGAEVVVQIDEPGLPAVLRGSLPTASGFGTVRAVEPARARDVLAQVTEAFPGAIVHCCHPDAPVRLFSAAGFAAVSLDLTAIGTGAAQIDPIGEALESGLRLLAGLVPSPAPASPVTVRELSRPLFELWNRLGLSRAELAGVAVTPTCGLSGADRTWAQRALALSRELAAALLDPPEGW